MVYLTRSLMNKIIEIRIDDELYTSQYRILKDLFLTFQVKDVETDNALIIYIYANEENVNTVMAHCKFQYKERGGRGYFYLANMLEEFYTKTLRCTVLHASMLYVFGNNVLIVGNRKSGKTTLTKYLIDKYGAYYIDDDSVYIFDNSFYGFNMPMFLRHPFSSDSTMVKTRDEEGRQRYVYIPQNRLQSVKTADVIVSPLYDADSGYSAEKTEDGRLFCLLLNNIRSFADKPSLLKDLSSITKTANAYSVRYNGYDNMERFINTYLI